MSLKSATTIFGPITIHDSTDAFPDLVLHNPRNLKNNTVMEVSFELKNIIETTSMQTFTREIAEWQVSFWDEGFSNNILLQLFQREADDIYTPPKIAIFNVKFTDPKDEQVDLAVFLKVIGEQAFLFGRFTVINKSFDGVYSHFSDILNKNPSHIMNTQQEEAMDSQYTINTIDSMEISGPKKYEDNEEFSIYSEDTLFKRGKTNNHDLEDQNILQHLDPSTRIQKDKGKQKERMSIPKTLSTQSSSVQQEEKERLKSKIKHLLGDNFTTDRYIVIYQSLKFHFLPCMDRIDDKKLTKIIKLHIGFHKKMDEVLQQLDP